MGQCRDCRWWDTDDTRAFSMWRPDGYGSCVLTDSGNSDWMAPWDDEKNECGPWLYQRYEASLAVVDEVDESGAVLTTSPDFGCVQFEAKP